MGEKKTKKQVADEAAVLDKIAGYPAPYRAIGQRLHEVILDTVPELTPRLWYGAAGYARSSSSPVLCFFRLDEYLSFGLTEKANIAVDKGAKDQLIESAWFITTDLDKATEERIAAIVRKVVA